MENNLYTYSVYFDKQLNMQSFLSFADDTLILKRKRRMQNAYQDGLAISFFADEKCFRTNFFDFFHVKANNTRYERRNSSNEVSWFVVFRHSILRTV